MARRPYTDAVQIRRFTRTLVLTAGALIATAASPVDAHAATGAIVGAPIALDQATERASELRIESSAFRLVVPF
jgi:hypothetical protein